MIKRYWKDGDLTKIENYELAKKDNFKGWHCHHRLELTLDGEFAHNVDEMKRLGMYYNRPYFELIFLPESEHKILHNLAFPRVNFTFKGHKLTEEAKQKLREARIGKPLSDKAKSKISSALKGKMVGDKNPMYGRKLTDDEKLKCRSMLGKHHSEETKKKMSLAQKNKCRNELSKKILEHYGFYERQLYKREKRFYNKNHMFSWEVK